VGFLPHPSGDSAAGRGSLLLGILFIGLGTAIMLLQHKWTEGGFWVCLGIFFLCYGAISLDWRRLPRALLLGLGIASGAAAFLIALSLSL
jgi:hypothetical protein